MPDIIDHCSLRFQWFDSTDDQQTVICYDI